MFEVGLGFQEEIGEVFDQLLADQVLEGVHVRPVQRLSVSREVPLDVAQFDVRPGVAHDAAKFRSNVLWRTIQNQEPGCELGVTSARACPRLSRRSCSGVPLARAGAESVVHEGALGLPLVDDLRPHAAPHVRRERDRDEGARGEDTD